MALWNKKKKDELRCVHCDKRIEPDEGQVVLDLFTASAQTVMNSLGKTTKTIKLTGMIDPKGELRPYPPLCTACIHEKSLMDKFRLALRAQIEATMDGGSNQGVTGL